ncbi:MAG: glutamate synthase [Myxococcales bacterium]|nr:glutamate synthase [Myxococcales bacterium]
MAELVPQPFELLLRRMAHELSKGACFDLPSRFFHRAKAGLDLSVRFHRERAATAAGPAAGPHSQLAQNLVLSYLAGGRVMELKTVQLNDRLTIPRPCIDARNVGFNVEWSQELRLPQSLDEYVKAWVLIHALRHADMGLGLSGPAGDLLFDMSVGYDLSGIRSGRVREFIDGLLDARSRIDALFERWPKDLLPWRPEREQVPNRISDCITLSTFHGCPAEEVERICEHLLEDVGVHVVAKLNPTLLGYEEVLHILHERLGYLDIRPHRQAFEADLKLEQALALSERLASRARALGLSFGAKLSNTLVVENHRSFFPGSEKVMYLSGQPLHVITLELCRRFRESSGEPLPISFSAGVDAKNFPDCVAAGFVPVTVCTDLLRPGGYGRLHRYLDNLATRMREDGVASVADFILAESGRTERVGALPPEQLPSLLHQASMENHAAFAQRALEDPRYSAAQNSGSPRRLGTRLWWFDCLTCDKCVQVCPNDANFVLLLPPELREARLPDLVVRGGRAEEEHERPFKLNEALQLANYADFCNECGNCDLFCPEEGGPYVVKPRFFSSRARMEEAAQLDGFAVEREGGLARIVGRHQGQRLSLELDTSRALARFDDGRVVVALSVPDFAHREVREIRPGTPDGHAVRLDRAMALCGLLMGALASGACSPVNAAHLPAAPPPRKPLPDAERAG